MLCKAHRDEFKMSINGTGKLVSAGPDVVKIEVEEFVCRGSDKPRERRTRVVSHPYYDSYMEGQSPGNWSEWPPVGTEVTYDIGPDGAGNRVMSVEVI